MSIEAIRARRNAADEKCGCDPDDRCPHLVEYMVRRASVPMFDHIREDIDTLLEALTQPAATALDVDLVREVLAATDGPAAWTGYSNWAERFVVAYARAAARKGGIRE